MSKRRQNLVAHPDRVASDRLMQFWCSGFLSFRKRPKFDGFQNKRPVRRAKGASKYPTRDTAKRISGISRVTAEHSIKKEGPNDDRVYS
ncbi:MAG TPA: hypothetical protein VGJ20_44180 [Xanthobacteraceae bacterium]|jgi:hypothetical protein